MTDERIAARSNTATIYDLGYRHYEGLRRGRLYAFWSLLVDTMRAIYGFGRPFRSKAVPFVLLGLYTLPAVFQIFALALAQTIGAQGGGGGEAPTPDFATYENYFRQFSFFIILFCVAQAPDLLDKDQRYHTLPLYFTRALSRSDYSFARLVGLSIGVLIVLLVPMAALFGGRAFLAPDVIQGFKDQMPSVLPGLAASALEAVALAGLSLAISAFSPRRAYSAISMIAYFLLVEYIPQAIYSIGSQTDWGWTSQPLLVRPIAALTFASDWFFGTMHLEYDRSSIAEPSLTAEQYLIAAVAMAVLAIGVMLFRYRRISA